jgi:hypothetical protein
MAVEEQPELRAERLRLLDATQEGRVLFLDGELDDALQINSVLSLPVLLEGIEPMLVSALEGDPVS